LESIKWHILSRNKKQLAKYGCNKSTRLGVADRFVPFEAFKQLLVLAHKLYATAKNLNYMEAYLYISKHC
jgi:hypothetical protein